MKRVVPLGFLLIAMFNMPAFGQETWSLSGQIRHRLEADNRDFNSDTARSGSSALSFEVRPR